MCNKTGGGACCIRIILSIINFIFLSIGIALFSLTAYVRWGDKFGYEENFQQIVEDFDLGQVFETFTTVLLIFSSIIIVISLFGFIGAICANKPCLIIYNLIIGILFSAHLTVFILLLTKFSSFENLIRKELNKTVDDIIKLNQLIDGVIDTFNHTEAIRKCAIFSFLSDTFECCAINGPSDFNYQKEILDECCPSWTNNTNGCADKLIDTIKSAEKYAVVIPNSVILAFELLILLMVFCVLKSISNYRKKKQRSNNNRKTREVADNDYNGRYNETHIGKGVGNNNLIIMEMKQRPQFTKQSYDLDNEYIYNNNRPNRNQAVVIRTTEYI